MFAISELFENKELAPLKSVHESDESDRRLVVVVSDDDTPIVNLTIELHQWLGSTSYNHIPTEWEDAADNLYRVVHISKLSVSIQRRDPFSATSAPVRPNNWLAKLPQEHFDALLLAQVAGDIPHVPNSREKQAIREEITADKLNSYWSRRVADVKRLLSGAAPMNIEQKALQAMWQTVLTMRHYDPTDSHDDDVPLNPPGTIGVTHWPVNWKIRQEQINFRRWIDSRYNDQTVYELKMIAQDSGIKLNRLNLSGSVVNIAHALIDEAGKCALLDRFASNIGYMSGYSESCTTVIDTGGGAMIGGSIVVNGDFIGGNSYKQ